jgi:hypothetical protein
VFEEAVGLHLRAVGRPAGDIVEDAAPRPV